jgi:hypothetical protein
MVILFIEVFLVCLISEMRSMVVSVLTRNAEVSRSPVQEVGRLLRVLQARVAVCVGNLHGNP